MTLINPIKLVKSNFQKNSHVGRFFNLPMRISMFIIIFSSLIYKADAQIVNAQRSGFALITTEHVVDINFGSGSTFYSAVWPIFKKYLGASNFQTGLGVTWPTSQRQPTDPEAIAEPPAEFEIGYAPIVKLKERTLTKVRVFILAGQSNMQGQGTIIDPEGDPGDLIDIIENDTNGDWAEVGQPNNWTTLDNVYLYYEADGGTIKEKVTVGHGANSNSIGPELMFAHQMDAFYEDPVLIIKTAWGGKSLGEDFRPPSAEGTTGPYYNQMIQIIQNVTQNLSTEFPDIGTSQFELTGFAWFQGWNDGDPNKDFGDEYESNLYHLVNDVRNDLGVVQLPFVVTSSGHGGNTQTPDTWVQRIQNIISVAQENVACDDETYGGYVGFVDTKPFYLERSVSPFKGIHHFHNNALTFLNIGKSMGNEMIRAINETAFCADPCMDEPSAPEVVSIGNRVWNDLNRDGINDPDEPGIPGVSVLAWGDSDGDGVPDGGAGGGIKITDEEGYYRFEGLSPGNYLVFVWSVNNWNEGEPLHGFVSTNAFVANANNDVDNDNNGSGNPFTDINSGIITLTVDGEPLDGFDPYDCNFNFDAAGNNTIDFGFYDPNAALSVENFNENNILIFPNPVQNEITIKNNFNLYQVKIIDAVGRLYKTISPTQETDTINTSSLPQGVYLLVFMDDTNNALKYNKIIKL
ncbi:sialate O-acetylesterase [Gaetbulibacter sp. M240]|uniref:sialate O-acetylesterase n=1 Tax=Gaetbulibacter sp. M240 TaxID=3126511 RepID=UPI00374F9BFA